MATVKIKVTDLRKIIREEYMKSVPDFVLKQATSTYVDTIRKHIQRYISLKTRNPVDARDAITIANESLKNFEDEANQLLEDHMWQLVQKI